MKKINFLLVALAMLALVGAGCPTKQAEAPSAQPDTTANQPPIGGQTDEHGCLGPAGYAWDEEIGGCLRVWELADEDARRAAKMAVEHLGRGIGLTIIESSEELCDDCFVVLLEKGEKHPKIRHEIEIQNWEVIASSEVDLNPPLPDDDDDDDATDEEVFLPDDEDKE